MNLLHKITAYLSKSCKGINETCLMCGLSSPELSGRRNRQRTRATVWASAYAFTLLASACSNTADEPSQELPDNETEGVTLSIKLPSVSFGSSLSSRAGDPSLVPIDNDQMKEGRLQDLYLVVFKEDEEIEDAYNAIFIQDIKSGSYINDLTPNYPDNEYRLPLQEGSYKFYLLANVYQYWANGKANGSKEDYVKVLSSTRTIEAIELNFGQNAYIGDGYLPMICLPKDICTYNNSTGEYIPVKDGDKEGIFKVTSEDASAKKTIELFAPMSILCSKVRYTVLFDNTDDTEDSFSKAFPDADIQFTNKIENSSNYASAGIVKFNNVYPFTPLIPLNDFKDTESSKWLNEIEKYIIRCGYPEKEQSVTPAPPDGMRDISPTAGSSVGTAGYFNIEEATTPPDYLQGIGSETEKQWDPATRRAWQSCINGETASVYLPENTNYTSGVEENAKYTILHLTPTAGTGINAAGYDIILPNMTRGYFYDIVAKMINSTMVKVEIYINVNPWNYNPQPEEW